MRQVDVFSIEATPWRVSYILNSKRNGDFDF